MEARIHVLTLAVDDLERALRFYRDGLGFESAGIVGSEFPGDDSNPAGVIAMFQLQGGLSSPCIRAPSWRRMPRFVWRAEDGRVQHWPRRGEQS